MTASESALFSKRIWEVVKSLSLFDTILYLSKSEALFEPENGILLFSASPESYDRKALYAILLLQRYSLQSFPNDISEASNIMLNTISLVDQPGYARFFHLLANRSIDLFEQTKALTYLQLGIELLERFSAVQDPGSIMYLMAAMEHACACLQYSLTGEVEEALEAARNIVNDACQVSLASPWISVFGDTRTKVILANIIRNRDEMLVPEEDLEPTVNASLRLLNSLSPSPECLHTAFQILVISAILFLSQSLESEELLVSIDSLGCILCGQQSHLSSVHNNTLLLISNAIDSCSSDRTICLIYMADVLDAEVPDPLRPLDINDQTAWKTEWEAAQRFLQRRITASQQGRHGIDTTPTLNFLKFKIHGDVLHRSSLSKTKVHEAAPVGTHICIFKLGMVPASDYQQFLQNSEGLTHYIFFEHLQRLCSGLSPDDLKRFSDQTDDLNRLFKKSRHLKDVDGVGPIAAWKRSPGVIAYIIFLIDHSLATKKRAARQMARVNLEHEPGYTQLIHRLVGDLRDYETDDAAIGISSTLINQFLRAQKRGTSMHFIGTMELATNYAIEFLSEPRIRRTALLALSLQLFREAVESRGDSPWFAEARKVVMLGRMLHNRLKYFGESEELLTQTIDHFTTLWEILPIGRPFAVSALEMITATALLYLSRSLEFEEWIDALNFLYTGLDLYINGLDDMESEISGTTKQSTLDLVLDGGINAGNFGLASKIFCLFHVSDMLRSVALDICRNPGYLELSARMYHQSLHLQLGDTRQNEDIVRSHWRREKQSLTQALIALTQPNSMGTSSPRLGEVPFAIFSYQATRPTKQTEPTSSSHNCIFRYHPTKVSYLPQVIQESVPASPVSESSSILGMPDIPAWPNDLMAPPPSFQSELEVHSIAHSVILPGVEKVIYNEGDEYFKMPLEPRTIKALRRSIEEDIHTTESQFSYLAETVVHQVSDRVYMDPREVQLGTRIAKMKQGSSPHLARIAPLQALLSRGPERCLELIESSRTLFWTKLLRLQATFDGLPEDLARELEDTAHALDSCKSQSVAYVSKEDLRWQFELEASFARLLDEARQIPGFENLLKPKGYEDLLQASVGGPVIVLMGTNSAYAALVITTKGVNSVFLPDLTSVALENLTRGLNQANTSARGSIQEQADDGGSGAERAGRPKGAPRGPSYESFLGGLWNLIVKPIFEFIGLLSSVSPPGNPRPRLWWCPTGEFTFLPLHAAGFGFGTKNMESVSKYAVSSFTPTLSALISARSKVSRGPPIQVSDLRSLVLCQPTTKGYASLPNTAKELALVESLNPPRQLLRIGSGPLISSNANRTVDEAVEFLKQASILHLACHGHQDRADPLNSGFELDDGRLTVAKLISCRPPKAFLAFLSACESASNDQEVPDESLNLSAAMLYAGFSSVIGTLWSMNDNDGPLIARSIYEEVFKDPTASLDPKVIPYALDRAVQKLQQNGVHPSRWATYIHVGI
ncbi:hypothetical protein M413DRAFT_444422 [Hebeloma cylindrosporum]|uniref:CHAT domain-containing protein n=1 Tax=Hebeloma cylindrosporum TaxID=76867 RepID=A0A0C3CGL7_HEBCY|nr:hypothetical protein M413DRAFT_444422 [Hebeloma cylindrosporum h7]